MSKKKILLTILLAIVLAVSIFIYSVWTRNKEVEKALAWIESFEGYIERSSPDWIEKWPKSTHSILEDIVGNKLKIKLYITDSNDGPLDLSPLGKLSQLRWF